MTTWVVFKIALRNVFSHKLKTIIVGVILTFGSLLAILGSAFVDAISNGMKNSTTQSITGDIQIYSKDSKDNLSVFGNTDGSPTDVGHLDRFSFIASKVKELPEVKEVIPMGTNSAFMNPGNILDYFIEHLRQDYKKGTVDKDRLDSEKERLRYIIGEIKKSLDGKLDDISFLSKEDADSAEKNLQTVSKDEFWRDFDKNFESKTEFLANKIAPLIFDDNMIYFSYLGTHPQMFQKSFQQFEVVKGEMIPEGERGFLFHDYFYENFVKHKIARRLDQMKKTMEDSKQTIAQSKELQDKVQTNIDQAAEIFLQIGPQEAKVIQKALAKTFSITKSDFRDSVKEFLKMADADFKNKYDFFYDQIAPYIILYRVSVGEILPVSAYTKAGSSTSVNLKVFGTFRFKSFENSPLAGNFSVMDLVSLRELYGFVTDERRAQNKEIEEEMNVGSVGREDVESLFVQTSNLTSKAAAQKKSSSTQLEFKKRILGQKYTSSEINDGPFMHAAVILHEPDKLKATVLKLKDLSQQQNLGFKTVSWQEAAGIIGQLTSVMKGILYFFISVSLMVAALMIVNSLLMAAMDRKQEIGTMRAIGAGRAFIYKLFFFETLFISLIFGVLGAILGSVLVLLIGKVGIPASGDVATFFFSGPRLYLALDPVAILGILIIMTVMAVLATQYPAWTAVQISPVQAMQNRE